MTISTSTRSAGPFAGTGAIVACPFSFKIFQASDLVVTKADASGNLSTLVLWVDYTVSVNADQDNSPGGTVTTLATLPVGSSVNITSNVPATQGASLTNGGAWFPKTVEGALDRLTILIQQLGLGFSQALRVPDAAGVPALPPAASRAGRMLGFDPSGNPIAVATTAGDANSLALDLANSGLATKGAGQVGFNPTLTYAAGTLGAAAQKANTPMLGDVLAKAAGGAGITIACYGDSITYSQDLSGTGTNAPINGASQTRSANPYPDALQAALIFAGFAIAPTVINRGFPGDSSAQGVTRWAASSATDVAIIMYGHNDANNYGGNGLVSVANFRANIRAIVERELSKGAAVIIVAPPAVSVVAQNELIRPYAQTLKQIAHQYGCPFIDAAEQLESVTSMWTDGVHLSTFAYNELGWHLAGLFLRRDGGINRFAEGGLFYASDAIGHGGTLSAYGAAKGGGTIISLAAGQTYAIGGYFEDEVQPVIHTVNSSGVNFTLGAYYAGGQTATAGVPVAQLVHDQTKGARQKLIGPKLRRGYRTLFLRNDGANTAFIEAIEFVGSDFATVSRGLTVRSNALTGVFQPARISTAEANWYVVADYSRKLTDPCNILARVTLTDVGGPAVNGLVLLAARQEANQPELLCANMLLILRSGTSLILRQLINGNPDTDTTVASVFSSGAYTGEIEVELTSGTLNVYVDGTLKGTRAVAQTGGFVGLIGAPAARFICHAVQYSGYVKGPY
jgi:lysophospholipase L1-like esterase